MKCDASCCRFAPMSRNEFKNIKRKNPKLDVTGTLITFGDRSVVMVVKDRLTGRCAFLNDDDTRCQVYEDRPLLCRRYGTDPVAPCQRCQPFGHSKVLQMMRQFKSERLPDITR